MFKQLLLLSLVIISGLNIDNDAYTTKLGAEDYQSNLGSLMEEYIVKNNIDGIDDSTQFLRYLGIENTTTNNYIEYNGISYDNIYSYKRIPVETSKYIVKISPDNNKIYFKYLGDAPDGVVTIEKDNIQRVFSIKNSDIIELLDGDGEYTIYLWETIEGIKCRYLGEVKIIGENTSADSTFTGQSFYSNYFINNKTFTDLVDELWNKSNGSIELYVKNCYDYVCTYTYNYTKRDMLNNNEIIRYRPDVNEIIQENSGICLDKATVLSSLLRAKGIPTRLAFGYYVDKTEQSEYHAWVEAKILDEWKTIDPTFKYYYTDQRVRNYRVSSYN